LRGIEYELPNGDTIRSDFTGSDTLREMGGVLLKSNDTIRSDVSGSETLREMGGELLKIDSTRSTSSPDKVSFSNIYTSASSSEKVVSKKNLAVSESLPKLGAQQFDISTLKPVVNDTYGRPSTFDPLAFSEKLPTLGGKESRFEVSSLKPVMADTYGNPMTISESRPKLDADSRYQISSLNPGSDSPVEDIYGSPSIFIKSDTVQTDFVDESLDIEEAIMSGATVERVVNKFVSENSFQSVDGTLGMDTSAITPSSFNSVDDTLESKSPEAGSPSILAFPKTV